MTLLFGCPIDSVAFNSLNVQINQSVDIRAEYVSPFTSGMFLHCLVFQQNGKYVYIQKLTFYQEQHDYK